jgi:3-oxoacyl-[acyl-carrier-protein] synthase III
MVEKGLLKKGSKIAFIAFGAGFTWSAGVIEWTIES